MEKTKEEKDKKRLEHYIRIYKNMPEHLTKSGKVALINMLIANYEKDKK